MLKLLTLPVWGPFWVIGAVFRARATVRAGRKTYPVQVRTVVRPVVVRMTFTTVPGVPQLPPPPP